MEFTWKTRTGKTPVNGLPRVFFCSGKKAYDDNFDVLSGDILEYVNCVIYHVDYENIPGSMSELTDELVDDLQEMQIIVVPVTKELFTEEDAWVRDVIKAEKGKKIILPIMMGEVDLWNEFEPLFGSVQFLDKYNLYGQAKGTEISYEKKLEKRLKEFLVGDELAAKVREAFDAKIFLSYRKKDRREAQELMRLIHSDPKCESIAIWYDEFLVPGEDYNEDIKKALESSNALVFNVTQSFNEPGNYVLRVEYPAAQEQEKKLISVEMSDTDIEELEHNFKGIGDSLIKIDKHEKVCKVTLDALKGLVKDENSNDMKHTFFLGLAYKNGLEVEVDDERGNRLIERAAEGGLPEAMEEMARLCFYVRNEFETAIDWQRKAVEAYENAIVNGDDGMDAFLGFQRAVMNVYSMVEESKKKIDIKWCYAIVEEAAADYAAKIMKQPEEYRERFIAMQYLRVDVVQMNLQQYPIDRSNYAERGIQEQRVDAIIKDVDAWWRLHKEGETGSIDPSTGEGKNFDDAMFVMEINCAIGEKTGLRISSAYNKMKTFEYAFNKKLKDTKICRFYIRIAYICATWMEIPSIFRPLDKNITEDNIEEQDINWYSFTRAGFDMCKKQMVAGELDEEWNDLYYSALYVRTLQLLKIAIAFRAKCDFCDEIETNIDKLYKRCQEICQNSSVDILKRREAINRMMELAKKEIELNKIQWWKPCSDEAERIFWNRLHGHIIKMAKEMVEELKDRESHEFYVEKLVESCEAFLAIEDSIADYTIFAEETEKEAHALCEKDNTGRTQNLLARAIRCVDKAQGLYEEYWEDDEDEEEDEEEDVEEMINEETVRQKAEKEWAEEQRKLIDSCGVKECDNEATAEEQLEKYEKVRNLGEESPYVYWSIINSLATLNMVDRAEEVYADWLSFGSRESQLFDQKNERDMNYAETRNKQRLRSATYEIEKLMAVLCEQNENYEDAKAHWQKVCAYETKVIAKASAKVIAAWEEKRKNTEERIAACDEKLKG